MEAAGEVGEAGVVHGVATPSPALRAVVHAVPVRAPLVFAAHGGDDAVHGGDDPVAAAPAPEATTGTASRETPAAAVSCSPCR